RRPAATVAVVVLLTALAVASIVLQLRPPGELPVVSPKDFYTTDDGDTWFVDDNDKITPFDHDGRPAVLVHLFTCDGGNTKFVGYLERLPDGAVEKFRSHVQTPARFVPEADAVAALVGTLAKRKGDTGCVSSDSRQRYR